MAGCLAGKTLLTPPILTANPSQIIAAGIATTADPIGGAASPTPQEILESPSATPALTLDMPADPFLDDVCDLDVVLVLHKHMAVADQPQVR
jgi:hypothetical protein